MEHGQLISFDGPRCGNAVSVGEVPVHPINRITTGSSGRGQRQWTAAGEVREGTESNACPSSPVHRPVRDVGRASADPPAPFPAWREHVRLAFCKGVSVDFLFLLLLFVFN